MTMWNSLTAQADELERLTSCLRIAVIYAGDNAHAGAVLNRTHNPRPWKSYAAVAHDIRDALQTCGFREVYLLADDLSLTEHLRDLRINLAWLNTGGVQGYNPMCHTPALLEMLGIPYVGADPLQASILDNKHILKYTLGQLGLHTAPFIVWHGGRGSLVRHADFRAVFHTYTGPFIVKPVSGRASHHIAYIDDLAALDDAISTIASVTQNDVLVEKFLPGREYCVSIYGHLTYRHGVVTRHEQPLPFSAAERTLAQDERIFTSMDQRPITLDRARVLADDGNPVVAALYRIARRLFEGLHLRSLIRIDLREDADGVLHIMEANPKPDLAHPNHGKVSLTTLGLPALEMSYADLIASLLLDRLDYLFTTRPASVASLRESLEGVYQVR